MKKFKFVLLAIIAMAFTSCEEEASRIEKILVIEQVNANDDVKEEGCRNCNTSDTYKYEVKIRSYNGNTYYYTNYRHEVGDTLLTSNMFIKQNIEERAALGREVSRLKKVNDSIVSVNRTMKFQYELMIDLYEKNIIQNKQGQ